MLRIVALVGIGAGSAALYIVLARRRRRAAQAWGWFTSATSSFKRDTPATLLSLDGKVPVRAKGPIAWLAVSPEPVLGGACLSIPVCGDENVVVAAVPRDKSERANALLKAGGEYKWVAPRGLLGLPAQSRASIAEVEAVVRATSLLAWHQDTAFSGADGQHTNFAPATLGRRRKTAAGKTLYPRMDAVAIVLVVSADGTRCLLGRTASYPPQMYTCISGFVEHGESAENAAVREVFEETHVTCEPGTALLVASQPWPCGRGNHCELMLGVYARAAFDGEAIDCTGDGDGHGELSDAKWFHRSEVQTMLARSIAMGAMPGSANGTAGEEEAFFVPPPFAIAHELIRRWAMGQLPSH